MCTSHSILCMFIYVLVPSLQSWNFHWSRGPEHFCRDRGTRTLKRSPAGPETRADDPTVRKQTQRLAKLICKGLQRQTVKL